MPKFCANLTMLFNEVDFLERFEKAAKAGFKGVEYLFPYGWKKEQIVERLEAHGLIQVLHNLPAGEWSKGERGIACLPGRETEFQDGVGKAIEYAQALKCLQVNCLVGLTPVGVPEAKVRKTLLANLGFAAAALEKEGIRLLIEALNDQDVPGFYLTHTADVLDLIKEVGHPNVYGQYDVYHMQIMEGNLIKTIQANIEKIAHIQIADNPGRNEPGSGEINFPNLFKAIDAAGYKGWIGCEYKPAGKTEDGIGWMKPYRG
ncbi:MAG: hydroxypyruvate isomerase [Thermodesulfobacteriota bacterium]